MSEEGVIIESQNSWGWHGQLEVIWSKPQYQTRPPRASCLGPCIDSFWISLKRETPQTLWATCASFQLPSQQNSFPDVQTAPPLFHFVPIASDPVTGHHWKESVFFAPSLWGGVNTHTDKILLSLLYAEQCQLSQPFVIGEMLQSLSHLCGPLLDCLQYVPIFHTEEPRTGHSAPGVAMPVLSRGEGSPPLTSWQYFVYCSQDILPF